MPRHTIFCQSFLFLLLLASRLQLCPLNLFLLADDLPGLRSLPTCDGYPDDLCLLGTATVDPKRLSLLLLHDRIHRNLPIPVRSAVPAHRMVLVMLLSPGGL